MVMVNIQRARRNIRARARLRGQQSVPYDLERQGRVEGRLLPTAELRACVAQFVSSVIQSTPIRTGRLRRSVDVSIARSHGPQGVLYVRWRTHYAGYVQRGNHRSSGYVQRAINTAVRAWNANGLCNRIARLYWNPRDLTFKSNGYVEALVRVQWRFNSPAVTGRRI